MTPAYRNVAALLGLSLGVVGCAPAGRMASAPSDANLAAGRSASGSSASASESSPSASAHEGPVGVADEPRGAPPVTPDASPEATKLLQFLYSISGRGTLAGQHCVPLVGSTRLAAVYKRVGHYPALFGQDFGFSEPGTWDGINYRQQIVDEAIRRYHEGFVIALMWHAVRPIEDEPVTFEASIQGKLSDREWRDLVTPGTAINERWKSQVDVIAWHLKQLRNAGVPVLWRPYHEMNGGWFWWGKRRGEDGFKKLYRMLFDRLVHFHGLNNLIWVYGANEIRPDVDPYETYYPGADVVDVLATDVYLGGFARTDYEALSALAGTKPIALAEVGAPPTAQVLQGEPRWTYFMSWNDPSANDGGPEALHAIYEDARTLTLEKLPWVHLGVPHVHYPVLE